MANRLSQVGVEVVMVPNPNAVLSQLGTEVVWSPVPGALLSQFGVEVVAPVVAPALANVLSQVGVEVISDVVGTGTNPGLPRTTQTVHESIATMTPNARVTQTVADAVLYPTDEHALVTQMVMEVVYHGQLVTVTIQSACFIAVQTDFPFIAVPAN